MDVKLFFIDDRPPIFGVLERETPHGYLLTGVVEQCQPYTDAEAQIAEEKHSGSDFILVKRVNPRLYERHHVLYVEQGAVPPTFDLTDDQYSGGVLY
jgi:hypothetical protein